MKYITYESTINGAKICVNVNPQNTLKHIGQPVLKLLRIKNFCSLYFVKRNVARYKEGVLTIIPTYVAISIL